MAGHSVRTVEDRSLNRLFCMGGPGVQLRLVNTHQATGQIYPDRLGIIFHHPVNRIAWQSILCCERDDVAVFNAAQPTLSCDPECGVLVEVETADHSLSQSVGG